jgi:UrcA family protein
MFNQTSVLALVLTGAIAASMAGASWAAEPPTDYSQQVKVADLNLASEAGARTLLQRIRHAATGVCASAQDDPRFQWTNPSYRRCVREASDRAVASLNSPMVTAIYGGQTVTKVASK